jgi:hypothetical protein
MIFKWGRYPMLQALPLGINAPLQALALETATNAGRITRSWSV